MKANATLATVFAWFLALGIAFAAEPRLSVAELERDATALEGRHIKVHAIFHFEEGACLTDNSEAASGPLVSVHFDKDALAKNSMVAYEELEKLARTVIRTSQSNLLRSPRRREIEVEFEGSLVLAPHTERHKKAAAKFEAEQAKRTPEDRASDPAYLGLMYDFDELVVDRVNWFRIDMEVGPNQPPQSTTPSVTPPAGQEARQP
jgi:hypothetical protein